LTDIALEDEKERFSLGRISGEVNWQTSPDVAASHLIWTGSQGSGVTLGAGEIKLRTYGDNLELLEPTRIPILDGALRINRLKLEHARSPTMAVAFDAHLQPIDLSTLTRALGWPEFAGRLSGTLPSLVYRDGQLTLGGELQIQAFDGEVAVRDLELHDPLGNVPRLAADIHLRNLDLKTLTQTFSFGRIEGRLSGDIEDLRLVGWQPTAFDARFYTPKQDRSRHRISQRAIQNISNIGGGGAAAALSQGFLRFFKDFSYDRIGLSCRLQEDVCLMSGLDTAPNGGYYIVRGSGLPRVDVIGYQREVSWSTLVEQLKSVTESEGPVIK
jgi:hypothetical protein